MNPTDPSTASASAAERRGLSWKLFKLRFKEWLEFDAPVLKAAAGTAAALAGGLLYTIGRSRRGLGLLAGVHRSACSPWTTALVDRLLRSATARMRQGPGSRLERAYEEFVSSQAPSPPTVRIFDDPARLLGPSVMVLKSPGPNERGVLVMNYQYLYPLVAKLFEVEKIARNYFFVLEPSWSGYCDLNILCFTRYPFPVFVESIEPRDTKFIQGLGANLVPVPVSFNWWVDPNLFRPLPGTRKDADLIMVAGWGTYKRHHRFFAVLKKLRQRGAKLRVILVGYALDNTLDGVLSLARHYGVSDQVEFFERLPPEQVNEQLNRAKVNVLWSRKEGVNRAIIEGMLAGIPCVLREGFNYGYHYPHVNSQTGCYSSEKGLPDVLLWMIEHYGDYSPREWVLSNMSCHKGTEVLGRVIKETALTLGEVWTRELAVKTSELNGQRYWEPADKERFADDYKFLREAVRGKKSVPAG